MKMPELIEAIRKQADCTLKPAVTLPDVGTDRLPNDLEEFYLLAGGATLFLNSPFGIEIVSPIEFVRANPIIVGDSCKDDITYEWYIVAKNGGQYITVDLAPSRLGRCYDSFWDRHGIPGNCQVVAQSFTDLLERLLQSKGESLFWLGPQFESIGDAYEIAE